jgi:hypothetical protein
MIKPGECEFPECLHPISAALHMMGHDPNAMVIELPRRTWWEIKCAIERKYPSAEPFNGRAMLSNEFHVMGVRFRARDK